MPSRYFPLALVCAAPLLACAQGDRSFVENRGQWPEPVIFKADLPGNTVWMERGAILFDMRDGDAVRHVHDGIVPPAGNPTVHHHAMRLRFLNADASGRTEGLGVQRGAFNFFQGKDPAHWASNAHAFAAVLQHDIYPRIDLRIRTTGTGIEYDLLLAPKANAGDISFTYDGADHLSLRDGRLIVRTSLGEVEERIPAAFQEREGTRVPVSCAYSLAGRTVSFLLGDHDPDLPLIIDPTLSFSTYSGATTDNFGYSAAYDKEGFLYAGSSSFGNGYPTTLGAYQTTWAGGDGQGSIPGTDIALTKFDTTGTFLIWSTMLGGSGDDLPHSLIVNDDHELILLGTTGSPDFPTTVGAFDGTFGGGTAYTPQGIGVSYPSGSDMVVVRLGANGDQLLGSTLLGGSLNDGHNSATALKMNYADEMRGEVLLGGDGSIYVISCTQSTNFPVTANAPQPTFGGGSHDGVVVRFNAALTNMLWSTFIGGSDADAAFGGEFNANGDLFVCGGTASANMPVTNGAYRTTFQGGQSDAFVARFSADGSTIQRCTYYGSSAYDQSYFLDLDQDGNVFLLGQTLAPGSQLILNAPYNVPASGQFIAKLDPTLGDLLMGSRFGVGDGTLDISPTAFLVDYCNKLYVSGWGSNIGIGLPLGVTGMPITANAYQTTTDGNDFYLAVFEVDMSSFVYGTYFGGATSHEHVDGGTSRFDRRGRVYEAVCAGCGSHDDFPHTPGAWSSTNNSTNCNLGVFKFDFDPPLVLAGLGAPGPHCANAPVVFVNESNLGTSYLWNFGDNTTSSVAAPTHTYAAAGTYTVVLTAFNPNACNLQDVDSITVIVLAQAPQLEAMADVEVCGPTNGIIISCTSFGTATTFTWSSDPAFTDALNASPDDSSFVLAPPISGTYYVRASTFGSCLSTDQVNVVASLVDPSISPDAFMCADGSATLSLSGIDVGSTIVWTPDEAIDDGQGTTTISVSPAGTTEYQVEVTASSGCVWDTSAVVSVSQLMGSAVDALVDQAIVLPGTTVQLSAIPATGVSYVWSPATGVSDPTIASPTAFVLQSTWFVATVSDGVCTQDDSVFVKVYELRCDEPDIFVPDAFTPNGDHNNDVLFVRGRSISTMDLKVFDRWGELVFESTDLSNGWDATFNGKPVDPAVFVYWLDVTCPDGQHFFKKGNVTVIR